MKKRIINAPTPETLAMLKRRMPSESRNRLEMVRIDAVGLIMLPIPDLYFYADRASKSAHVAVSEIFGSLSAAYHDAGHIRRGRRSE
ncbi:hypothetical protein ACQFN5_14230 [Klebsiella sp. WOUb02]|uniref:hypothetical protein n=1 Tax=Klebsiella sp. WOUb02 TaxID=3161071 RepID=UPI003CF34B7F